MLDRRLSLLLSLAFAFVLPACHSVSVGADNRYGYSRGAATVNVPIDTVADQVKAATTRRSADLEGPLSAQVISVHDGDSITVLIDGRKEKVRLIGIDAPELDQAPWGVASRDTLRGLLDGKIVRLETDITSRDQYARLLAYIYVGDLFVNAEMVRQGQAVIYTVPPNVAHVEEYRKAQTEAREAGRGVRYAIRLPANDNLERDIAELLTRPVGRPSHQPVAWYKGFLYQAASWKTARRVVAKVEFHGGELFPRVGFIVTNLETESQAVVRFYNKRGTAEQWIKEGKQAVKMTRLSCPDSGPTRCDWG